MSREALLRGRQHVNALAREDLTLVKVTSMRVWPTARPEEARAVSIKSRDYLPPCGPRLPGDRAKVKR